MNSFDKKIVKGFKDKIDKQSSKKYIFKDSELTQWSELIWGSVLFTQALDSGVNIENEL